MKPVLGLVATAAIALSAVTMAPAAATEASDHARRPALQSGLDDVVSAYAVGGLAEVRSRHHVGWRGSSGVAELGTRRPVPVDGRFRAGSITKTFLAVVVLQLVAEGRLRLDDTVEQWLPGAFRGVTATPSATCSTTPAGCSTTCTRSGCRRTRNW